MELYANKSGQSGVYAFGISDREIHVNFKGGETYVYNYSVPGINDVERMKVLARAGSGLNGYINKYVKDRYARKY